MYKNTQVHVGNSLSPNRRPQECLVSDWNMKRSSYASVHIVTVTKLGLATRAKHVASNKSSINTVVTGDVYLRTAGYVSQQVESVLRLTYKHSLVRGVIT
jgi:hypothetical protein